MTKKYVTSGLLSPKVTIELGSEDTRRGPVRVLFEDVAMADYHKSNFDETDSRYFKSNSLAVVQAIVQSKAGDEPD